MMEMEAPDKRIELLRALQETPTIGLSVYFRSAEQQLRIDNP